MTIFLTVLAITVLAPLITYFVAPKALLDFIYQMARRRSGLTEKSVEVEGLCWPYLEGGPQDGIPIVLIHGYGGDKDNWTLYARHFTGKFRFICMDLPAFGDNDKSLEREYDMETQARRVIAFLDALGIDKCHLGGNSMGGFVTLVAALNFPERLESIALFNNAGVAGAGTSELQKQVEEKGINPLAVQSVDDVKRLLAFVAYKPIKAPRNFRKINFEQFDANRELLDRIFWSLVEDGMNHSLNDRLNEIKIPTFIIWGRHDQVIDVSCVDALTDGIVGSKAVILEETGHIPMIERPALTARHHLQFLAKI